MPEILAERACGHLLLAQAVALRGTGSATEALGVLACDLAGVGAAMVLLAASGAVTAAFIWLNGDPGCLVHAFTVDHDHPRRGSRL